MVNKRVEVVNTYYSHPDFSAQLVHQVTPKALIHEQRPGDTRGLSCPTELGTLEIYGKSMRKSWIAGTSVEHL